MKKTLVFSLAALLLFTGAACTKQKGETQKTSQSVNQNQENTTESEDSGPEEETPPGPVVSGKEIKDFFIAEENTHNSDNDDPYIDNARIDLIPITIDPDKNKVATALLEKKNSGIIEGNVKTVVTYGGKQVLDFSREITKEDYQRFGAGSSYFIVDITKERADEIVKKSKNIDAARGEKQKIKITFTANDGTKITKETELFFGGK